MLRACMGMMGLLLLIAPALGCAGPRHLQAVPAGAQAEAKLEQKAQKLQAQAARHHGPRQAEDWSKLAEVRFELAELRYGEGQPRAGNRLLEQSRSLADRAVAILRAEFARGKTSRMRSVEIPIQQIAFQLQGMVQQAPPADRAGLAAGQRHFAALDAEILKMMFTPKSARPR